MIKWLYNYELIAILFPDISESSVRIFSTISSSLYLQQQFLLKKMILIINNKIAVIVITYHNQELDSSEESGESVLSLG